MRDRLGALCGTAAASDADADAAVAECAICMAAPRGARLRPCCHAVLCAPCAASILLRRACCPVCRAAVEHVEEGIFPSSFAPAQPRSEFKQRVGAVGAL